MKKKVDLLEMVSKITQEKLMDSMNRSIFGDTIKYRNKKVTKYLKIPYPSIQKHYDYEYGDYEGLLLTIEWYTTKIPIGKETIKVPVFKKMGGTFKFTRLNKQI